MEREKEFFNTLYNNYVIEHTNTNGEPVIQDQIEVTIKSNYGNDAIYPHCSTSKCLARLAGTKTLTPESIAIIKQMGYTVAVVTPTKHL